MLKGLWKLTWVETKIFLREPGGLIGTLLMPVGLFLVIGRSTVDAQSPAMQQEPFFNAAIFGALVISVTQVISLVIIISLYRESGILKRLRATPLSPVTILGSHVLIKLTFTLASLLLLVLSGREFLPAAVDVDVPSFTAAVLLSTLSIISLGFVVASLIRTSRFAQRSALMFYLMFFISGAVVPIEEFPPALQFIAHLLPATWAVFLMEGVWAGEGWDLVSAATLVGFCVFFTLLSSRIFRWE